MPLQKKGACKKKVIRKNTAAEISSGKKPNQAAAIAHSVCRRSRGKGAP